MAKAEKFHSSIYLSKATWRAIRQLAAAQDRKPNDIVLEAIDLVLKAHEPAADSVLTVTHSDGKTLQYKGIPVRESVHVDLTGTDDKLDVARDEAIRTVMKYFPDMSEADRRTVLLMLVNVTWNDEDEAPAAPVAPAKSETACIAEIMTTMCTSEAPASVPADDDSSGIGGADAAAGNAALFAQAV